MSLEYVIPAETSEGIYEQYLSSGNDFPILADVPYYNGLYESLVKIQKSQHRDLYTSKKFQKSLMLRGWLCYEQAMAMHADFPDSADEWLDQAVECFNEVLDYSAHGERVQRIKGYIALANTLQCVNNQSSDDELTALIDCLEWDDTAPFNSGYLGEYALAAVSLLPPQQGDSEMVPIGASLRQDTSQGGGPFSKAIDLNMYVANQSDSTSFTQTIVPTQVKSRGKKLRRATIKPEGSAYKEYDESIKVICMQDLIELYTQGEFNYFRAQMRNFVSTGNVSPYLQDIRATVGREFTS